MNNVLDIKMRLMDLIEGDKENMTDLEYKVLLESLSKLDRVQTLERTLTIKNNRISDLTDQLNDIRSKTRKIVNLYLKD